MFVSGNKVFIIGNGFDISLGYPTKYNEFAKSSFWPFAKENNGLANYLESIKNTERWLDIENELLKYATSNNQSRLISAIIATNVHEDYSSFVTLSNSFERYIDYVQNNYAIDENSAAMKVLYAVLDNGFFSNIYSFNYTNLTKIANHLGINHVNFEYVHGSVENHDSILGVQDNVELKAGYDFLYKTYNKNYPSCPIQFALEESEEVIIFGHSLGPVDYHYFQDFFTAQCRDGMSRNDSKIITIITWNNESRLSILRQLRSMNKGRLQHLYSKNQFQIICTDGSDSKDSEKMNNLLTRLHEQRLR